MKIQIAALVVRVFLGAWFLSSGGWKIFVTGLDRFTRDIGNYRLVSEPLDAVAAYTVPWVEVVAGLFLLLGILRKGTILTMAGLVTIFSVAVGWAWSKNLDISCGCHGGDEPLRYWWKAAELAGYFIVLGWLWRAESRRSPADGNMAVI